MGTLMDCEQVRELLDAYALGAADPADAAVVDLGRGADAFIGPASTRQWDREAKVRTLA